MPDYPDYLNNHPHGDHPADASDMIPAEPNTPSDNQTFFTCEDLAVRCSEYSNIGRIDRQNYREVAEKIHPKVVKPSIYIRTGRAYAEYLRAAEFRSTEDWTDMVIFDVALWQWWRHCAASVEEL